MDFQLTEDHLTARKWAHEFAEREIRPVAPEYDESEDFPWPVVKKAAEIGLYSLDFWTDMVAGDQSGMILPIVMEETSWGCAGISLGIFGTGLPLATLAYSATPEQLAEAGEKIYNGAGNCAGANTFIGVAPEADLIFVKIDNSKRIAKSEATLDGDVKGNKVTNIGGNSNLGIGGTTGESGSVPNAMAAIAAAGSLSPISAWRRSKMAFAARVAICCPTIARASDLKLSSRQRARHWPRSTGSRLSISRPSTRSPSARRPLCSSGATGRRNNGASVGSVVKTQIVIESVASNLSSCTITAGRGLPA